MWSTFFRLALPLSSLTAREPRCQIAHPIARAYRHPAATAQGPTGGLRSLSHADMGQVFLIAVVSALDAGLLTAAVVLLGRPQPARQLGAYLIGGIGFSIIFGLLIVLALHGSSLRLGRSTQGVIEVAAGPVLIVIAIAEWSGRTVQWQPRPTR